MPYNLHIKRKKRTSILSSTWILMLQIDLEILIQISKHPSIAQDQVWISKWVEVFPHVGFLGFHQPQLYYKIEVHLETGLRSQTFTVVPTLVIFIILLFKWQKIEWNSNFIIIYRPANPNLHILLSKKVQIRLSRSVAALK